MSNLKSDSPSLNLRSQSRSQISDLRSPISDLRSVVFSIHNHFTIGRHAGLGETTGAFQLQLHPDHLLDAIVTEICVLRSERCLRVNADYLCLDPFVRG